MRSTTSLALFLAMIGCGGDATSDGGAATDSGSQADLGPDHEGGVDVGSDVDAGPGIDARSEVDGGTAGSVPVGHCGAKTGEYFPDSSWIYTDVSGATPRTNSAAMTAWLEAHGGWGNSNHLQIDTSFVINDADGSAPRVTTAVGALGYSTDCDPSVSFPMPAGGRVEGQTGYTCPNSSEDCHLLVADFSAHTLFEAYQVTQSGSTLETSCNIAWDMTHDSWGAPPAPGSTLPPVSARNWGIGRDCTGPDAAGFPIAPLLFTVGDVMSGQVRHAIRFALPNNRMQRAPDAASAADSSKRPVYVWPATHAGGPSAIDPDAPIYGTRWRLHAGFDPASRGLDPKNPVVIAVVYGLKHYGMLIADGGNIALMAEDASDCSKKWSDLWGSAGSRVLDGIRPSDFDVLDTGGTEAGFDCARNAGR